MVSRAAGGGGEDLFFSFDDQTLPIPVRPEGIESDGFAYIALVWHSRIMVTNRIVAYAGDSHRMTVEPYDQRSFPDHMLEHDECSPRSLFGPIKGLGVKTVKLCHRHKTCRRWIVAWMRQASFGEFFDRWGCRGVEKVQKTFQRHGSVSSRSQCRVANIRYRPRWYNSFL